MHLYAAFIQNLYIFAEVKERNTKRETNPICPHSLSMTKTLSNNKSKPIYEMHPDIVKHPVKPPAILQHNPQTPYFSATRTNHHPGLPFAERVAASLSS